MSKRHPEGEPETITGKGPRGMNKVYRLIRGQPKKGSPPMTEDEVEVLKEFINHAPSLTTKRKPRRGMREH